MAKGKHLSEEQKEEIYTEIIRGVSYRRIAKNHRISISTVTRVKKEKASFLAPKPKKTRKMSNATKNKISNAVATNNILKKSDIIIGNILDVGKAIVKGAEKLDDIADNSQQRVDGLLEILKEVNEKLDVGLEVNENDRACVKRKEDLMKRVDKTLRLVGSYYSANKLVIEAIRELRAHAETYVKIKMGADAIESLDTFVNAIFSGMESLSDEEYLRFRDHVVENSELGKHILSKYDPTIQN